MIHPIGACIPYEMAMYLPMGFLLQYIPCKKRGEVIFGEYTNIFLLKEDERT
jgi:hypothetical protein